MKLEERLKGWLNQDILVEFVARDNKGDTYDTKGKLIELGEDYFVINELDEGGEKYLREELYLFNGILSIGLYRQ